MQYDNIYLIVSSVICSISSFPYYLRSLGGSMEIQHETQAEKNQKAGATLISLNVGWSSSLFMVLGLLRQCFHEKH